MTDHGKQLAVAWFQFLPSPNDLSSQADADALDGDDFGGDGLDTTITAADDDEVAWADSTAVTAGDTGASPTDDWLFEAVTAPAAESASPPVTPLEG